MHGSRWSLAAPIALGVVSGTLAIVSVLAAPMPRPEAGRQVASQATTPTAGAQATSTPVPTPEEGECVGWGDKAASSSAYLGGRAGITLTFQAYCRASTIPLHIAFVLDGSETMAGEKTRQMKAGVIDLVESLAMEDHPTTEVAVIEFNSRAYTRCRLTASESRTLACIRRIRSEGEAAIDLGLREGLIELVRGRSDDQAEIHEALVLVSDGQNQAGCVPVLQAANQAKSQGLLLLTVCVGEDCDTQCLRQASSAPRYHYEIANIGGLASVFDQIREELPRPVLRSLSITDAVPDNFVYIADSAVPEPTYVSHDRSRLTWTSSYVPLDGVTITLDVEPRELGRHPTNVEARAIYEWRDHSERELVYPVPYVDVVRPSSATATRTASPAPTATPTVWPLPTSEAPAAYLPVVHLSGDS